jgi:uncharacterized phage-associated protein
MHDARAISNFLLDRASQQSMPITVMTLLKVLYFAHAWYLVKNDRPLVAQPFEAWKHGPVNRVVYEQLKGIGARPITTRLKSFYADSCRFEDTKYMLDAETKLFLENIFDYYSKFHAFKLSDLTHEHGSPWHIIWSEAEKRAVPGMVIPNKLISEWFREDRGQIGKTRQKGWA